MCTAESLQNNTRVWPPRAARQRKQNKISLFASVQLKKKNLLVLSKIAALVSKWASWNLIVDAKSVPLTRHTRKSGIKTCSRRLKIKFNSSFHLHTRNFFFWLGIVWVARVFFFGSGVVDESIGNWARFFFIWSLKENRWVLGENSWVNCCFENYGSLHCLEFFEMRTIEERCGKWNS